VAFATSVNVYT